MKYWIFNLITISCFTMTAIVAFAHEPALEITDKPAYNAQGESLFTQKEIEWLEKKQIITYAFDPDWAPFEWKNEIHDHTGIIADILNLITEKSGIALKAVHTDTWEESVELVKNGQVDMFSAITQNSSREEYLNFTSRDIYSYPAALVTKFDDHGVYLDPAKDLKGKKIGIVKGSGLGQYIKKQYPELEYVELPATHDGFYSIQNGTIDLFAINTVTAKYYIEKKAFDDLKIALKLDYFYHLKIAIRKGLPDEIISIIDKSLASIEEDELNHIFNKWTEIPAERLFDWKRPLQICAVLFAVIILLIWNNRRLNLMVKTRTEELSTKNLELTEALNDIKTLRGIIPICSYCHSIRDDEGAWSRLEAYLSEHSDAQFSHGICPKCHPKVLLEAEIDEDINQL